MTQSHNTLADLRDIQLPDPISVWPLAPGWYILAGLLLMCVLGLGIYFVYQYRKIRIKQHAVKLINQWQKKKNEPNFDCPNQVAALLKRVAMVFYPERKTAHLYGDAWLAFLDETGRTQEFSQGAGRFFAEAHYQKNSPDNIDELCELAKRWIKRIK